MNLNSQNIDHELLESIADGCVAALKNSPRPDARRWSNAIRKAVAELETNCYWNYEGGKLTMLSTTSTVLKIEVLNVHSARDASNSSANFFAFLVSRA